MKEDYKELNVLNDTFNYMDFLKGYFKSLDSVYLVTKWDASKAIIAKRIRDGDTDYFYPDGQLSQKQGCENEIADLNSDYIIRMVVNCISTGELETVKSKFYILEWDIKDFVQKESYCKTTPPMEQSLQRRFFYSGKTGNGLEEVYLKGIEDTRTLTEAILIYKNYISTMDKDRLDKLTSVILYEKRNNMHLVHDDEDTKYYLRLSTNSKDYEGGNIL